MKSFLKIMLSLMSMLAMLQIPVQASMYADYVCAINTKLTFDQCNEITTVVTTVVNPKHTNTILAIITTESRFDQYAKSKDGAIGYMQVLPKYHRKSFEGQALTSPFPNIVVGYNIYLDCLSRYKDKRQALTCYNDGNNKRYKKSPYPSKVLAFERVLDDIARSQKPTS